MLVLSRKPGEKLLIGNDITVTVVSICRNRVRVGIDAPGRIRVCRVELARKSHVTAALVGIPLDRVKEVATSIS
jgi:carbon storage regulator